MPNNNNSTGLFAKGILSLKTVGFKKTLLRLLSHPFRRRILAIERRQIEKRILSLDTAQERFTEIYKANYWGSDESVSGHGSTFEGTANLRAKLPEIIEKYSIKSIFDAPCGDFNWMRHVLKQNDLDYTGGDIVLSLIESLNVNYRGEGTRFIHLDLTKDKFPYADMMICRDCLFHLSYQDTRLVLQNFVDSKIPYLLTSTHGNSNTFQNKDILTGNFRHIDLFSAPYHFPRDVAFQIVEQEVPGPRREICLWTRGQIISALKNGGRHTDRPLVSETSP